MCTFSFIKIGLLGRQKADKNNTFALTKRKVFEFIIFNDSFHIIKEHFLKQKNIDKFFPNHI